MRMTAASCGGQGAPCFPLPKNAHDARWEIQIDGLQFDELGNAQPAAYSSSSMARSRSPSLLVASGALSRRTISSCVSTSGRREGSLGVSMRAAGLEASSPVRRTTTQGQKPRERAGRVAAFAQPSDEQRDVFVV